MEKVAVAEASKVLEQVAERGGPWAKEVLESFHRNLERGLRPRAWATITYLLAEGLITDEEAEVLKQLVQTRY